MFSIINKKQQYYKLQKEQAQKRKELIKTHNENVKNHNENIKKHNQTIKQRIDLVKNHSNYVNNIVHWTINKPISTIILTSTVNIKSKISSIYQTDKNERLNIYLTCILKWLTETNFNIIVVENSGHYFITYLHNEKELYKNRFEIITFNENELDEAKYLSGNVSKGDSEIFAINYAFNNSKLIKEKNPVFIIKITGRYFIPKLEEYLKDVDLDKYDCLTQFNSDRCEMIGSHYNNFGNIFNLDTHNEIHTDVDLIENVYKYRTKQCKNNIICKEFQINETKRGGFNATYITI